MPLLLPFLAFHPLGEGGHENDGEVGEEGLSMVPAGGKTKQQAREEHPPPSPYGQPVR